MKESDRYLKIVRWSEEDGCYVGTAPGFMYGGCHGPDERQVYADLCAIVQEVIASMKADGDALPPPTIDLFLQAAE